MDNSKEAEEAFNIELLWPLVPDGGTEGLFDWFSGVIALNVRDADWQQIVSGEKRTNDQMDAMRTYGHELVHFFQFTTMSFPYYWSAEFFTLIRPIVKRVRAENDLNDMDFAGVKKLVNEGSQLLTSEEKKIIKDHLLKIDIPGPSGITTRAIFESHAYFVERKLHYDIKDVTNWLPHLENAPAPIYRVAFDMLTYTAGFGVAYEWFPLVASLALSTPDPTATFEELSLALMPGADEDSSSKRGLDSYEMLMLLCKKLPDLKWSLPLGTGELLHPVLGGAARTFNKAEMDNIFERYVLYAKPEIEIEKMLGQMELRIPIIFKPTLPGKIAVQQPTGMDKTTVLALFAMGAVCRQLTKEPESETEEIGRRSIDQLSWLMNDRVPVSYKMEASELRSGKADTLVSSFAIKDEADFYKDKIWGRCYFEIPEEMQIDPATPFEEIPEVMTLIRDAQARLPLLLIYFARPFGQNWLQTIAPESAKQDGLINILHPEVIIRMHESELAIDECANKMNLNVWLAKECLFGEFKRTIELYDPERTKSEQ